MTKNYVSVSIFMKKIIIIKEKKNKRIKRERESAEPIQSYFQL